LIRDQLPASDAFHPDKNAPIFSADGLSAVLAFERDAADHYCAVLVDAHGDIFFLIDLSPALSRQT